MSEHEYCTDVLYDKYVVTEISLKIQGFVSTESVWISLTFIERLSQDKDIQVIC